MPADDPHGAAPDSPFVREIVREVAFPLGTSAGTADPAERSALVERTVRALVRDAAGDADAREDAARRLASQPPLLAAFFQNADLLYDERHPSADAVSAAVMRAVELLGGEDGRPPDTTDPGGSGAGG
ncbi:MAG: hypothetical protein JWM27_1885 [Gemmatimonadetes bacterium]|nr:hypothetical protein [Gemmatimonadota bacterium]